MRIATNALKKGNLVRSCNEPQSRRRCGSHGVAARHKLPFSAAQYPVTRSHDSNAQAAGAHRSSVSIELRRHVNALVS
ncbi:MAG: hypothetical protein ACI9TI_002420, partial [Natronomonas sp.]